MAEKTTRILVDRKLAEEAMREFGAKSLTEGLRLAVELVVEAYRAREQALRNLS